MLPYIVTFFGLLVIFQLHGIGNQLRVGHPFKT